jgi:hypothetical protein
MTAPARGRTFEEWLTLVDQAAYAIVGCSYQDLADFCWRDSCEDGLTPRQALRAAMEDQ